MTKDTANQPGTRIISSSYISPIYNIRHTEGIFLDGHPDILQMMLITQILQFSPRKIKALLSFSYKALWAPALPSSSIKGRAYCKYKTLRGKGLLDYVMPKSSNYRHCSRKYQKYY